MVIYKYRYLYIHTHTYVRAHTHMCAHTHTLSMIERLTVNLTMQGCCPGPEVTPTFLNPV